MGDHRSYDQRRPGDRLILLGVVLMALGCLGAVASIVMLVVLP
jgi:hypothetical protein